jgi:hypothetical protein
LQSEAGKWIDSEEPGEEEFAENDSANGMNSTAVPPVSGKI